MGFLQFNLAKLWGTEFDKPEKTVLDKEVSEVERLFTHDEIRSVLALANPAMRAMIYLGLQGGYGNTDLSLIKFDDLDLKAVGL